MLDIPIEFLTHKNIIHKLELVKFQAYYLYLSL